MFSRRNIMNGMIAATIAAGLPSGAEAVIVTPNEGDDAIDIIEEIICDVLGETVTHVNDRLTQCGVVAMLNEEIQPLKRQGAVKDFRVVCDQAYNKEEDSVSVAVYIRERSGKVLLLEGTIDEIPVVERVRIR